MQASAVLTQTRRTGAPACRWGRQRNSVTRNFPSTSAQCATANWTRQRRMMPRSQDRRSHLHPALFSRRSIQSQQRTEDEYKLNDNSTALCQYRPAARHGNPGTITCSKKDTNLWQTLHQILNDFLNSFTGRVSSKFAVNILLLEISPHFQHSTTLPCEILMSENKRDSETDVVINGKAQGKYDYTFEA